MEKGLAFLIFMSSALSAFCMWGMTYTFFTGKVPFDIQPVIFVSTDKDEVEEVVGEKTEKTENTDKIDKTEVTESAEVTEDKTKEKIDISREVIKGLTKAELALLKEKYIIEFYERLIKREKKLEEEQKIIFDKERNIKVTENNVKKLQEEMKRTEERVETLMSNIKKEETENLKNISNLIASLDIAESQKILLEYNDNMIARILRFMNKKSAAKILTGVLKTGDDKQVKRIKLITEEMRRLMEEG